MDGRPFKTGCRLADTAVPADKEAARLAETFGMWILMDMGAGLEDEDGTAMVGLTVALEGKREDRVASVEDDTGIADDRGLGDAELGRVVRDILLDEEAGGIPVDMVC